MAFERKIEMRAIRRCVSVAAFSDGAASSFPLPTTRELLAVIAVTEMSQCGRLTGYQCNALRTPSYCISPRFSRDYLHTVMNAFGVDKRLGTIVLAMFGVLSCLWIFCLFALA